MDAQTIQIAGFAAGLVLGFAGLRTNFCVMGAITDIALMRDWRRFRAWLLAIAVALAGTETLILAGLARLDASAPTAPSFGWLAAGAGGLAFGFGMVLAGGCGQRNLVRVGAGSIKALVVVLVMAGFAHLAVFGALAPVRLWLMAAANPLPALDVASQDFSVLLTPAGETAKGARAALAYGSALLLAWLCFKDTSFRASARDVTAGAVIGLLVAFGWAATSGADAPESLNFAVPLGDAAARALGGLDGEGGRAGFAFMAVPGVVLGAFLAVAWPWRVRFEFFADARDAARTVAGAALMGLGGATALGCTIGQGVAGVSTLAAASLLAWAALVAGALLGVRYLEARAAWS
jgi:uncharacterized membrane protein YedE/YeeE